MRVLLATGHDRLGDDVDPHDFAGSQAKEAGRELAVPTTDVETATFLNGPRGLDRDSECLRLDGLVR